MKSRLSYRFPFSRYPAFRIALFLIGGILFAQFYQPQFYLISLILGAILLLWSLVEWKNKAQVSKSLSATGTLLFLGIIFLFGVFRMSLHAENQVSETIRLIQASAWEEVTLSGAIQSISTTSSGKVRWDLTVDSTFFENLQTGQPYKARILADEVRKATLGDQVTITGTIIPISEKRNPRDFNYKQYLNSQEIYAQVKAERLHRIVPNEKISEWVWWREQALKLADQNFGSQTSPIAKALLIGYKQELDTDSKTAFARAGLSHIMAVSGLHVGFIVAPFWIIIPYFWTKKHGSTIGLAILILLLICYAGITGFSASVTRASVMAFFLSYGKLFHKVNDSINLMAAAAVVLLLANPAQLFDIGFQLSFSAVFIILLILPVIQNLLPYWVRVRWYGKPLMVVIVSIVVQFGLYPLQVYYFGEISLVSPIANALFVPFLGIVVPLSLIALGITGLVPAVGFIINYPSMIFLSWMSDFVHMAAKWEWSWTTATFNGSLIFLLWGFLIFSISAYRVSSLRWKLLNGFLVTACLITSINLAEKLKPATLQVTFFDVGQGDAALLQTPTGKNILIDAGIWSPGYNSGKSVIIPHLKSIAVDQLDAVILSHPHADHIGGILDLLKNVPIDVIYNSGYKYDSKLYHNYLELAEIKSVPVRSLLAGDTLNLDPAMLFLILGPDGKFHNSDPNEHSLVIHAIYGESEFLFTGDAGTDQEERLLATYDQLLDTDVLKVGHHGSRTSSSLPFLNKVTPDIAVISLDLSNRFRHPHKEALLRLQQTDADILFTSLERAIILKSDGNEISRVHW